MTLGKKQLQAYGAIGAVVVTVSTAVSVLFGERWPWLLPANALVCWAVGKLFGVPLDAVLSAALTAMKPAKAVALTVGAVQSMPPDKGEAVARSVLEQIAASAVAVMPHAQATSLTRSLLEQIPPETKARLLERIIFLSGHPMPLPDALSETELPPPPRTPRQATLASVTIAAMVEPSPIPPPMAAPPRPPPPPAPRTPITPLAASLFDDQEPATGRPPRV